MADESGDKQKPTTRDPELIPAMMAIALAVAAQLALQDGLALLGAAGYIVAAWLFVASVRGTFDNASELPTREDQVVATEPEAYEDPAARPVETNGRLAYLRRNWRLVTLAEIFRGDIPPARLQDLSPIVAPQVEPGDESVETDDALVVTDELTPSAGAAHMQSWTASEAPESAPRAVKVTPQGDVLVLDIGLGQIQRFDDAGNLLATYSLAGLAELEVLDLAVSPDGRTLYIVDAASKRLQVINLADDETLGEEE